MDLLSAWGLYEFERNTVQAELLLSSGQAWLLPLQSFWKKVGFESGLEKSIDLGLKCEITGGEGGSGSPFLWKTEIP